MQDLSNIGVIQDVLRRHGFTFSKALGQNFLVNPSVCPRMAEMSGANENTGIIEIGTGIGVLTAELAKRAKKVVCIELDTRLLPVLDETLAEFDNVEIINEDIMKVDLAQLIKDKFDGMRVCVCANLPYYITSPVIMLLLESGLPFRAVTVMVQKEAADRLCAEVGTRESGAVTVAVQYYAEAEKLFSVSRGSFMPSPNVDSAVIRLTLRNEKGAAVTNEKKFFRMVRSAFSQRRKTAVNGISSGMSIPKAEVTAALVRAGLSEKARVESLKMEELARLCEELPD